MLKGEMVGKIKAASNGYSLIIILCDHRNLDICDNLGYTSAMKGTYIIQIDNLQAKVGHSDKRLL